MNSIKTLEVNPLPKVTNRNVY